MKRDLIEPGDDSSSFDVPLVKPSAILFFLGVFSVSVGIAIGIVGVLSRNTTSNSQEYLLGFAGYLLTALIPIVLLQIIRHNHGKALENNQEQPYDIYAGSLNQSRFLKVVFLGLISAALSIWVFFQPIAEKFAT